MWVGGFVNGSFFGGNGILLIWFVSVGLATVWLAKGALLFVVCCVWVVYGWLELLLGLLFLWWVGG